jgi:hypothetical protein
MKSVRELEEELRQAKQNEEAVAALRRNATPPIWRYTVAPSKKQSYDHIYDDTCVFYTIRGEVLNVDEAEQAGWYDHEMRSGAMRYIFNKVTGRIVTAVGGGTIYVGPSYWNGENDSHIHTMAAISAQIVKFPDVEIDITNIINAHREAKKH